MIQGIICFLLYISLVPFAVVHSQCGISLKVLGLIVNGTQSQRGAWPWLVSLHLSHTDGYFCGGTLIDSETVITAAHCIQDKNEESPRGPNDIIIKLGRYDLLRRHEQGGIEAHPLNIFIHSNWSTHNSNFDSDIALIKLKTPVVFNDAIRPICMWNSKEPPAVHDGYIVGYGRSDINAAHENIPRELDVKITPIEDCVFKNPAYAFSASKNTFCAGKDDYSSACEGDSGGGLFIEVNNRWYLRGIVSSKASLSLIRCDPKIDTLYTDVLKFSNWINEMTSPMPSQQPEETISNRNSRRERKEIVCSIANWAAYRKGSGKFTIDNFKPELCTTAIYHFAGLSEDGELKSIEPWLDLSDSFGLDGFRQFTYLRESHPHLRLLLSVGGWNEGVEKYSKLAASDAKRKAFAIQSAAFLKQYEFDGLDFYWDYPGDSARNGSPDDKQNFPLLLKEIKDVYRQENLYLSVTLRASRWTMALSYNLEKIEKHVDSINMMTFDYAGAYDKKIGYPAALKSNSHDNSVDTAVNLFLRSKVPKNKIIMGIPFHVVTFKTTKAGNIGDEAEIEGFAGPFNESSIMMGYNELCMMASQKPWFFNFHKDASQMIGIFIENGKLHVAIYDSPRAVANKVKFAMEKDLLGIWVWSVDQDDINGDCPVDQTIYNDFGREKPDTIKEKDFQLLRTINNVMKFMNNRN